MHSAFAYSSQMQVILTVIAFVKTFITMYLIAKLIENVYFARFSTGQKTLFAFLTGTLLNNIWVFGLYALGGRISFSPLIYMLVTSANPAFALLYYCIGIAVLKLPARHAGRLMGHVFLYYMIMKVLNRLVASMIFMQGPGPYNYMLDALQQLTSLLMTVLLYYFVVHGLRHIGFSASLPDQMPDNPRRDLMMYLLKAAFVYVLVTFVPLWVQNQFIVHMLLLAICVLMLLLGVQFDINSAAAVRLENKNAHGNALRNSIEELSDIKRNFHTILQGYQEFLTANDLMGLKRYHDVLLDQSVRADGEMQLSRRMEENPALVSLLISKTEAAKRANIRMHLSIQAGLDNLPISNMDLCRIVACLFDNAIEASQDSEPRRIQFSVESKPGGGRLIILTNSTANPIDVNVIERPGVSSKPGHMGLGLPSVRKTLAKYDNCTLHTSFYDSQFSVYLAIKP